MRTEIKSEKLLSVVNTLIQEQQGQSDEFKAGMNFILKGLQDYIKGPPFVLKEEFKKFALENFLNNDESQVPVFSNLIELFEIKMSKMGRKNTWEVYPDDMDKDVTLMLKECFAGVSFTKIYTDFDRQAVSIDITVKAHAIADSAPLDFSGSDGHLIFDDGEYEEELEYHEIDKFNRYIIATAHYETLFLLGCLKTMFKYVDAEKVEQLLKAEKK